MNIKSKIILLLNLLYCYIPVFLFLLGWVKLWIAIPTSVVLCYFLYMFIAKEESNNELHISRTALMGGGWYSSQFVCRQEWEIGGRRYSITRNITLFCKI